MNKTSGKKVEFKLTAPHAREVRLAGDFNSWDPNKTLLRKAKDGVWRTDLSLKPGRYEYKFVVDGEWRKDPLNNLFSVNTFGTENSVVEL